MTTDPLVPPELERFARVCRQHARLLAEARDGGLRERLSCPAGHTARSWLVVDVTTGRVVAAASVDELEAA